MPATATPGIAAGIAARAGAAGGLAGAIPVVTAAVVARAADRRTDGSGHELGGGDDHAARVSPITSGWDRSMETAAG